MNEIQVHDAALKFVECPYALGDTSKGYDCLSMLYDFYKSFGVQLPEKWNGWTLDNYAERWDRGEGREDFLIFLKTLGQRVKANYMQRGDLIIFKGDLSGPAIYLGNGLAVRIFFSGGKVHSIRNIKQHIDDVRRLI